MHEFSIARSIVDIAEEAVASRNGRAVERIILDIGQLSGVELDALTFVWEAATKNSVLESAERVIHTIPGRAKCLECEKEFEPDGLIDACSHCGSCFFDILKGKEMQVRSLVIIK